MILKCTNPLPCIGFQMCCSGKSDWESVVPRRLRRVFTLNCHLQTHLDLLGHTRVLEPDKGLEI